MHDDNHRHVEVEVTICNVQGLHARPVMRFVDLAGQYVSRIQVCKGTQCVDGKSPMEMMLLEGTRGTVLKVVADGDDAPQAAEALVGLINGKFGED